MPKQSEALILRTYPLREADLLVTFFTRAEGKVKGVAKSAKRSKRRFGGALEPLTYVVAHWEDKEKQELARLDSCDIISSPLTAEVTYSRSGRCSAMLPKSSTSFCLIASLMTIFSGLRFPWSASSSRNPSGCRSPISISGWCA